MHFGKLIMGSFSFNLLLLVFQSVLLIVHCQQIYTIYDISDRQPKKNCDFRELKNGFSMPNSISYMSGTTIRYECYLGYQLEPANSEATCDDGNWDRPPPMCSVLFAPTTTPPPTVTCEPLSLENGVVLPPNPPYKARQSVAFKCNEGYERNGTAISICLGDSTWALPPPTCEAKEIAGCLARQLANGQSQPQQFVYESKKVVIYKCNDGYVLKGNEVAACFKGTWTAEMPICEKKKVMRCKRPQFSHGNIYPRRNTYRSSAVVKYSCKSGYSLKGQTTATCYDGKWTAEFPRCEDSQQFPETTMYCEPPVIEHGSFTPQSQRYTVGFEITLLCGSGYFRVGPQKATCQENGEWTELHTCNTGCKEPIIANGYYNTEAIKVGQYFSYGSVIIINCNPAYIREGEGNVRCGSNNQWEPNLPICKELIITITERGCLPPSYDFVTYSPKLQPNEEVYSVGDKITFICKGDKYALGHNFAECLSSGKWSKRPTCRKKCVKPAISNGRIDKTGETFQQNTVIRVICDEGFLVVGQKTARCRYDGVWSANLKCTDGCLKPKTDGLSVYPIPIEGGDVYEYGKSVEFRCDAGFSGPVRKAECRGKNQWDKSIPSCQLISDESLTRCGCRRPELTEGLMMKNEIRAVYPYKTQFEFQCANGFNMIGSAVSICRKHLRGPLGGLDPSPPRCERKKCGSPGKPQNGRFRDGDRGSYLFEDTVYYVCDDKHIMSGADHLTCQADGQFNGVPPLCQPPSCRVECVFVDGRDCQCDATCRIRGDCCGDFEQHCRKLFY